MNISPSLCRRGPGDGGGRGREGTNGRKGKDEMRIEGRRKKREIEAGREGRGRELKRDKGKEEKGRRREGKGEGYHSERYASSCESIKCGCYGV